MGSTGCLETSVTRCITTQKSAHLEEALDQTLWRTRYRGYGPVAKTDYARNSRIKISPLIRYCPHLFITWFALMGRQLLRHPHRVCCTTQTVRTNLPYIFSAERGGQSFPKHVLTLSSRTGSEELSLVGPPV